MCCTHVVCPESQRPEAGETSSSRIKHRGGRRVYLLDSGYRLKKYLIDRFKGADEELHLPAISLSILDDNAAMSKQYKERVRQAEAWLTSKLSGRNGIVVFDVSGWGDASGHFTLWDGNAKTLAYADPHDDPTNNLYYFWLTELRQPKAIVQTTKVRFWELK